MAEALKAEAYMRRALRLAERGAGYVSPNPLVGAVIVKNNAIIGEGWHARCGAAHAEAAAIADAEKKGHSVTGAELFVTLEPCAHFGKQPPCADLINQKKIAKVAFAVADPNPKAMGGAEKLRQAGIEVTGGIMEREARWQNRFFFHAIKKQRPYFLAKLALSADGMVAAAPGKQTRITGEAAERFSHRLRQNCDAVLVGAATVETDDPLLSVRHGKSRRDPLRLIIDPRLTTPVTARVYRDARHLIISSPSVDLSKAHGRRLLPTALASGNQLDLFALVENLNTLGLQSVLIEGGPHTLHAFQAAGLIDEWCVLINPTLRLPGGVPAGLTEMTTDFVLLKKAKLGQDRLEIYSQEPC